MSLLNQPFAMPSRVKGALELLLQERSQRIKRESAEALLSPSSLKGDEGAASRMNMIRRTIDECVRLQLFIEDGDYLSINPDISELRGDSEDLSRSLPGTILNLILDIRNTENQDLAASFAWYLGQDPLDPPATWAEFGETLNEQGAAESLKFNDTRYDNFAYWSRYLGVANMVSSPTSAGAPEYRLFPDPTDCLRPIIHELLSANSGLLSIAECIQLLSVRCPLFEGGRVREVMDNHSPTRQPKHLSATTSFALLRLEEEGMLAMQLKSDAKALILVDAANRRSVSEISLIRMEG